MKPKKPEELSSLYLKVSREMLWIGDIHVSRKNATQLVDTLRQYISSYPNEQHIVFLGDYVYHFQYERAALLNLYQVFLDLYAAGKQVYVLAGNHDWIHNYFVYEEAKRSFDAHQEQSVGAIHFITEPQLFTIEGQDCLFFPYTPFLVVDEKNTQFLPLRESTHLGEQLSGKANAVLSEQIAARRQQGERTHELWIFHHWYIADTQFPGQKAIFSYKHHALAPEFAQQQDLLLISGHLHQPFVRERYICVGSIWYTSPLEVNQVKYLFQVDTQAKQLALTPVYINPHIRINQGETPILNTAVLEQIQETIATASCQYLSTDHLDRSLTLQKTEFPWSATLLTIESEALSYTGLDEYLAPTTAQSLQRVVIKRPRKTAQVLAEDLGIVSEKLDSSISHRKELLETYVRKKYQDESDQYINLLVSLGIL